MFTSRASPPPPTAASAERAVQYRGPAPTAPGYVPPPASAKRGGGWKIALGVVLGLFVLMGACLAVIANSADDAVKQVQADLADGSLDNSTAGTAPAPKTVYKVGDTAKTGDFEVTVYGFKDPQTTTNQFDKPAAGKRFNEVKTGLEAALAAADEDRLDVGQGIGPRPADDRVRPLLKKCRWNSRRRDRAPRPAVRHEVAVATDS